MFLGYHRESSDDRLSNTSSYRRYQRSTRPKPRYSGSRRLSTSDIVIPTPKKRTSRPSSVRNSSDGEGSTVLRNRGRTSLHTSDSEYNSDSSHRKPILKKTQSLSGDERLRSASAHSLASVRSEKSVTIQDPRDVNPKEIKSNSIEKIESVSDNEIKEPSDNEVNLSNQTNTDKTLTTTEDSEMKTEKFSQSKDGVQVHEEESSDDDDF